MKSKEEWPEFDALTLASEDIAQLKHDCDVKDGVISRLQTTLDQALAREAVMREALISSERATWKEGQTGNTLARDIRRISQTVLDPSPAAEALLEVAEAAARVGHLYQDAIALRATFQSPAWDSFLAALTRLQATRGQG